MLSLTALKNILNICDQARDISGQLHSVTGAISMSQVFDNAVYKPEYFKTYEVVDPITFATYGDKALQFMDSHILWTFDALREYFNTTIIINNYNNPKTGTVYKDSGLRIKPVGTSARSQHLYGRAGDLKITGVSAEEARQEIIKNHRTSPAFRFITAIELGVSWLHVDCRNTNQDALLTFTA